MGAKQESTYLKGGEGILLSFAQAAPPHQHPWEKAHVGQDLAKLKPRDQSRRGVKPRGLSGTSPALSCAWGCSSHGTPVQPGREKVSRVPGWAAPAHRIREMSLKRGWQTGHSGLIEVMISCARSYCANVFTRDEDDGSSVIKTNFVSDVNKRLHYTSVYLTTLHLGNQQIWVANGTVHHSGSR